MEERVRIVIIKIISGRAPGSTSLDRFQKKYFAQYVDNVVQWLYSNIVIPCVWGLSALNFLQKNLSDEPAAPKLAGNNVTFNHRKHKCCRSHLDCSTIMACIRAKLILQ